MVDIYNDSNIADNKMRLKKKVIKDCKCPKILVVDDNEYNIYALRMLLKNEGYGCDYTNNGLDAT